MKLKRDGHTSVDKRSVSQRLENRTMFTICLVRSFLADQVFTSYSSNMTEACVYLCLYYSVVLSFGHKIPESPYQGFLYQSPVCLHCLEKEIP